MIQITPPQNPQYWINQRALTFSENDLENVNRIAVSLVSGTVIMVYEKGVIDYAPDGNFQKWTLKGYSTRLVSDLAHKIYARLSRTEKDALIVFSINNYNIDGSITTIVTDANGNPVLDEDGKEQTTTSEQNPNYWYVKIGEITATVGNSKRELTYDSGALGTSKGVEESAGWNEMFELSKQSTLRLIFVKQMFYEFTVKNPITLLGGLIFKNNKGEEKKIVDIKRSTDSDADVPIDDNSIPTTAYVKSINEDKYLKKYEPDETEHKIKFYDGIEAGRFVKGMIGGSGTQFDGNGYGEMTGLTLREFLEVPELRFNRIDVVSGELWNSIAFGLVESVDTTRRICTIKLEGRERCGLKVNDICRGIFADFGDDTQWEGIDECNFLHLYGFKTSYFTPTDIIEDGEGVFRFRYALKSGTDVHPCQSMKFAVYGNFIDPTRQASAYSTRTYKRYLNKVDTWVIDPNKHIYAQYGKLDGLTVGGMEMVGYGSFQSNSYFTGVQIQFTPQQMEQLKGEDAYSVTLSDYEGIVVVDDEGNIIGGEKEMQNVVTEGLNVISNGQNVVTSGYRLRTQVQAFRGSKPLFYSPAAPDEGSYIISLSSVGCTAVVLNGVVMVTSVTDTARSYVNVSVNCEGKASFQQTYYITAVSDGRNPITADMDNEMDAVACDSDGNVLFGLPVKTTVSMWAGVKKLVLDRLEITNMEDYLNADGESGVTAVADKTTGEVIISSISQSAPRTIPIHITAYATYGGTQYHKDLVFTVNKVNAGENALLYKLSPSASSIKVAEDGSMTATSVYCEVVATDGNKIETLSSLPGDGSVFMEYSLDGNAFKSYTYKSNVQITAANKTVTFRLYVRQEGGSASLIDVETVPLLLDGSSPAVMDLDNEMQSVACDENGNVTLGLPLSTGVKMFYGNKELDITITKVDFPDGVTGSYEGNTVTVKTISAEAVENLRIGITATASYGGMDYERTAYLVVNKLKQGDSAMILDLSPAVTAIKVDDEGKFTPKKISCATRLTNGKNGSYIPEALQSNYQMKYSIDGGTENSYTYGNEIIITPELDKNVKGPETSVTFFLYYKNSEGEYVLVDRETVPVVKDAVSPVIIDLENEMQSVACDENGNVLYGLPLSTGVKMYFGSELLELSGLQVSSPSANESAVATGVGTTSGTVTVNAISRTSSDTLNFVVVGTAAYGSTSYTRSATLTVNKVKQGESAAVLDLVPSVSSVMVDNEGGYYPASVTCTLKQTNGKDGASSITSASSLPSGYSLAYKVDGGTEESFTLGSTTIASAGAKLQVEFLLKYNGVTIDRETVPVVKSSVGIFKSTVFYRSNEEPSIPTGGSYDSPVPTSSPTWTDGIPSGEAILWASTRIFTSDGSEPQQSAWSKPRQMTDTASFDVEFSSLATNPGTPDNPASGAGWSNASDESTVWMATNTKVNGVWTGWQVSKIKGEKGDKLSFGDLTDSEKDSLKGDKGDSASYYVVEASVASIGYTMTGGYSPSSFGFSEYHIVGGSKTASNAFFVRVYGQKNGGSEVFLKEYSTVSNQTFDASSYQSSDYDVFIFKLCSYGGGTVYYTTSVSVAKQGKQGNAGVGINSTTVSYAKSTSFSRPADSAFSTTMPTVNKGEYLWTRTIIDYTDSSKADTVSYSVSYIGKEGESVSVSSVTYQAGSSPTTKPTGTWLSSIPSVSEGQYLWTKTVFTDGSEAYSVARQGKNGDSITVTEIKYQAGTSPTTAPTGIWLSSIPSVSQGEYLWSRTTFSDGSVVYGVARQGKDGGTGSPGPAGAMPRYCGYYKDGTEYIYNSSYRDIVLYMDNVFQVLPYDQKVTSEPPSTATSNSYWEVANKFSFVATDVLLADRANLAGFTFTRTNSDLSNPIGRLESQNGTLVLDASDGSLTCDSVNLTGVINATSGTFNNVTFETGRLAGFNVASSSITSDLGAYSGGAGLNSYPDSRFFLYASGPASANLGYSSTYRRSTIGLNTLPNITESAALGMFTDTQIPENYQDKIGLYISIQGGSVYDNGYQRNSALYIEKGHIAGYRRRLRRTNVSVTLNAFDGVIVCTHTSGSITITLPSAPEDGQEYWIISASQKEVNVAVGSSSHTITRSGSSFSTDRWHVYVFDAHNKKWLYSYMNY